MMSTSGMPPTRYTRRFRGCFAMNVTTGNAERVDVTPGLSALGPFRRNQSRIVRIYAIPFFLEIQIENDSTMVPVDPLVLTTSIQIFPGP